MLSNETGRFFTRSYFSVRSNSSDFIKKIRMSSLSLKFLLSKNVPESCEPLKFHWNIL